MYTKLKCQRYESCFSVKERIDCHSSLFAIESRKTVCLVILLLHPIFSQD